MAFGFWLLAFGFWLLAFNKLLNNTTPPGSFRTVNVCQYLIKKFDGINIID